MAYPRTSYFVLLNLKLLSARLVFTFIQFILNDHLENILEMHVLTMPKILNAIWTPMNVRNDQ